MSTEYAGTATYHPTCTLPSDGDPRNATTLGAALQDIIDRTTALHDIPNGQTVSVTSGGTLAVLSGGFLTVADGGNITVTGDGAGVTEYPITLQNGAGLYIGGISAAHGGLYLFGYTDVTWANHSTATWEAGSTATFDASSTLNLYGAVILMDPGIMAIDAGAQLNWLPGSTSDMGGVMTISGSGRIRCREFAIVSDANQGLNPQVADHFWIPAGIQSAARTYTLSAGAVGERVTISTRDVTYAATIANTYGPDITLGPYGAGNVVSLTFDRLSDGWFPVAHYQRP